MADYNVDPDVAGGGDGSESAPWQSIGASQWTTINTALASEAVTVYFSARKAASDTNQLSTDKITLDRTDGSSNLLTLDGMSKYNTNDSTPSWSAYSGSSRFQITSGPCITTTVLSQDEKRSYITIKGFECHSTSSRPIYYFGGDNVTIQDCILTQDVPGNSTGIYFHYANHPTNPTPGACSNITIKDNVIHHVYGEGMYIGGSHDINLVAHDNFLIEGNTVYECGFGGGEADGIDIKDAITNCVVRGNTVYMNTLSGRDGININSCSICENNFVYNFARNGITIANFWDAYANNDNPIIRNNIIVNCNTDPVRASLQITSSTGDDNTFTNVELYNNTVVGSKQVGVLIEEGVHCSKVYNNIVINSVGYQFDATTATIDAHNNNLYWRSSGGTIARINGSNLNAAGLVALEPNSLSTNPVLLDVNAPYVDTNFHIGSSSPCKEAGFTVGAGITDYFGTTRTGIWDIGAHELTAVQQAGEIADGSGNLALPFSRRGVTNNVSGDTTPPLYSSSEIGVLGDDKVVVTFSEDVTATDYATGVSIRAGGSLQTISTSARQASLNKVTYTLSSALVSTDIVTWEYSGTGTITDIAGNALALVSQKSVTNNITPGVQTPVYLSSEIGSVNANTVEVTFSEGVSSPSGNYSLGVTIKKNGASTPISTSVRQTNTSKVRYTLSIPGDALDTFTWEYNSAVGDITNLGSVSGTIDIMLVGDSITELDWQGGFRFGLYHYLNDAGMDFDFVGRSTENNNSGAIQAGRNTGRTVPSGFWDHEGYVSAGYTIPTAPKVWNTEIVTALASNSCDVMLVHLGTNDAVALWHYGTYQGIVNACSAFMDNVWGVDPNIHIFMCQIIPPRADRDDAYSVIQQYNGALPALVDQKVQAGRKCTLIDCRPGFSRVAGVHLVDQFHPSVPGYEVMTDNIGPVLISEASGNTVALPTTPAQTVTNNINPVIPSSQFVGTDGINFTLNGSPWYFNGTNMYYAEQDTSIGNPSSSTSCMDNVILPLGMNAFRCWFWNHGTNYNGSHGGDATMMSSPGVFVESNLVAMDSVVDRAKSRGIKIIACLVGGWGSYGGMHAIGEWAGYPRPGNEYSHAPDGAYTSAAAIQHQKTWITYLLNRVNTYTGVAYKDEPAIAMWEICGEARMTQSLISWYTTMAQHIKSIDTNHIVSTGGEGFEGSTANFNAYYGSYNNPYVIGGYGNNGYGASFYNECAIPEIDCCSIHGYPDAWFTGISNEETNADWFQFLQDSASVAHAHNKPIYMGEWGSDEWPRMSHFNDGNRYLAAGGTSTFEYFDSLDFGGALYWQVVANNRTAHGAGEFQYPAQSQYIQPYIDFAQVMNAKNVS